MLVGEESGGVCEGNAQGTELGGGLLGVLGEGGGEADDLVGDVTFVRLERGLQAFDNDLDGGFANEVEVEGMYVVGD